MNTLSGMIFDFNGVLLWDTPIQEDAWRQFSLKLRGRTATDEELRLNVHGRTNPCILEYLAGRPLSPEEVAELTRQKEKLYMERCLALGKDFQLSPGATDLLDELQQHEIPFTIATASGMITLKFFFQYLDLGRWFQLEKIAYDNGHIHGKPAPDLYLIAAQKLELPPARCVVAEDSVSGIAAAHAAGIGAILALGPKETHPRLLSLPGVTAAIASFREVKPQQLFATANAV